MASPRPPRTGASCVSRRVRPISTIVESHQRSPYPAGVATSLLARNPAAAHALGLLSALAGAEIHTREVARRTRHDVHSAQLALTQLLREGFVQSRRFGNLRIWSVDPNSPEARRMGAIVRVVPHQPDTLASELTTLYHVCIAFITGY